MAQHHTAQPANRRGAFTLLEVMLALGIVSMMAYFAILNLRGPLERSALPESGRRLRSLISLTRANAMIDGKRYRMRFLREDDEEAEDLTSDERRQPFVEIERDPVQDPGYFTPVLASWAQSEVFIGNTWCYDMRPGEPTAETMLVDIEEQELLDEEERREEMGLEDNEGWVLILEPDGTSEWMVFRLIDHPEEDFDDSDFADYAQLAVVLDGRVGTVFLQRPLHQEEVDILADYGHSPLLRRDFIVSKLLTDDDVIEIDMGR